MASPENGVARYAAHYPAYALDNGCYAQGERFDLGRFLCYLALQPAATCLFAVAPDVVGDAAATWRRSAPVLPAIRRMGFRAALVAQDGLDVAALDWDAFDVLFVGGSTAYKLSEAAYGAVREAKRRGKATHMGRCNGWPRIKAAAIGGYDSADGSGLAINPGKNLPRILSWLDRLRRQAAFSVEAA